MIMIFLYRAAQRRLAVARRRGWMMLTFNIVLYGGLCRILMYSDVGDIERRNWRHQTIKTSINGIDM